MPTHTDTAADARRARPLYTPEISGQIAQFERLMQRQGWGTRAAGRRLGCTQTVISRLLTHSYPAPERWVPRMTAVIRHERFRHQAPTRPHYVETSVAKSVVEMLALAHMERTLVMVLGATGVGKTLAIDAYVQAEPDTIRFAAGPSMSIQPLLDKLAHALNIHTEGVMVQRRDAVTEALRDTDRLVIVDECDYMPESALQTLRMIQDEAQIGMALVGTPAYLERLRARNSPTLDQVLGRVAYVERIDACPEEDLRLIAGQFKLPGPAVDLLVAGAHGSARRLAAAIVAAQRIEQKEGKGFSERGIREAYAQLMPVSLNGDGASRAAAKGGQ